MLIAGSPQDPPAEPLVLKRLESPVRIDGVIDGAEWAVIEPLPLVMYQPTAGGPPTDRSEIRVGYDGEAIIGAARFWVSDPSHVRAASLYRDRVTEADDVFRIMIDSFNDRENALNFIVTPAGTRIDMAVSADGLESNYDWNGHWQAATRRHPDGWSAEIRIPLSTLRFRSMGGRVRMRLLVARRSAARSEIATFPAVSPEFNMALQRPSLAHEIELEAAAPANPVYLTPYTLGANQRVATRPPGAAGYHSLSDRRFEVGADLKYGIGSDVALDLTANTDFAQVEADDQQVNLTRFSLFFPEKRQFFQERAGLFSFSTGGFGDASRLFHSRRIGLDDGGRPLRIYGGARLVGRTGPWDVGLLAMQVDRGVEAGSDHFGVYRARRTTFNPQSYLGAIATVRLGARNALAYGVDAQVRTLRNDFLTVQWAQTFADSVAERGASSGMARLVYERRSSQGLVYYGMVKWSGADHDPAVGFNPRRDFRSAIVNLRYGWYPGSRTVFRSIQPSFLAAGIWRNQDDRLDTGALNGYLNFELKNGIFGYLNGRVGRDALPEDLPLGPGVVVPAGSYDQPGASLSVFTPGRWPFRTGVTIGRSRLYDGESFQLSLSPTWNVSQHLELGLVLSHQRVDFDRRAERLEADIYQFRAQAAVDSRLSVNSYVQYNRLADQVVGNLRLRFNFAEGRDLYLVYNDRLNTDRGRFLPLDPELPFSQERSVIVKYSHTLTP
jgi:hypothetical protein